ncbi:MAG TPA: hypothetical protein VGL02_09820 [Streptomyces sp.]
MANQTDLVNVDFWADRIAAVIKLAEHHGMTVDIVGGELVVSRQVSEVFTASTEVRWRAAATGAEAQHPEPPCCSDPTWTCVQVNAEGLCECVKWDEAQQQPETHSCGNCEGVDPDTCLVNPTRAEEHRG